MNTTTRIWWENLHGGEIYCDKHIGSELHFSIAARPRAKRHMTSFGTWKQMTEADAQQFLAELACEPSPLVLSLDEVCESCRFATRDR